MLFSRPTAKVLIAESNDALRSFLSETLEWLGCEVVQSSDGAQARSLFEKDSDSVHLVILRSELPILNGVELLKAIRQRHPTKPILFMKESLDEEIIGLDAACEVLAKPFSKLEFTSAVRRCLT